jgi:threonine/homoserine/homoserine lactone efflux protein
MYFSSFFSYTFLTAYTPGPNNIMAMTNGSRDGFKRSIPFLLGIFSGFIIVMTACATFTSLLYEFIPKLRPVMVWLGAAYILWLAWTIWTDKKSKKKSRRTETNSFLSGMLLQFVNVKIILYGITAMSSYILPNYHGALMIQLFALLLSLIGTSGCICWAFFGAAFEKLFNKYRKQLNIVMALLLVYCAISLLL